MSKKAKVNSYIKSNGKVKSVKVPSHHAMVLTHNKHFTLELTIEEAISRKIDGYTKSDWISEEERALAMTFDNHWMIQGFVEENYYTYSGSDVAKLLEYVSKLKEWGEVHET